MPDLFAGDPFTRDDKIGELRREIVMREHVYARQVERHAMTQDQADRGLAVMRAILADYEGPGA